MRQRIEEAYKRYALAANRRMTNVENYRALATKYLVRRVAELMGVSEAEVRAMSDEDLALCRDECLLSMSEDEVRDMVRECPTLQNEWARWRALQDGHRHAREAQHDDAAAPMDDSP